jgi:hypothetical protein
LTPIFVQPLRAHCFLNCDSFVSYM